MEEFISIPSANATNQLISDFETSYVIDYNAHVRLPLNKFAVSLLKTGSKAICRP
jgi:hypothetical protein